MRTPSSSSYPDDVSLVAALVAREPEAAATAWERFAPLVRSLLWQSLGGGTEIDDLSQDVFLHFFRRIDDLREPAAVRAFLVGIAVRVARGELRRRRVRRWLSLSADGETPEVVAPAMDEDAREALRRLYGILDRIDDDARMAFVLRHVRGLELTEVAAAVGCSLATVKRRIAKANERVAVHARGDATLALFLGPRSAVERERESAAEGRSVS